MTLYFFTFPKKSVWVFLLPVSCSKNKACGLGVPLPWAGLFESQLPLTQD